MENLNTSLLKDLVFPNFTDFYHFQNVKHIQSNLIQTIDISVEFNIIEDNHIDLRNVL